MKTYDPVKRRKENQRQYAKQIKKKLSKASALRRGMIRKMFSEGMSVEDIAIKLRMPVSEVRPYTEKEAA